MSALVKKYILQKLFLSEVMLKLIKLAIPVIGSSMLFMAYNVTDMIWVGKLGSGAVAAVGSASFFLHLGWAIASIITVGTGVKISHSVGAKDKNSASRYATTGVWGVGVTGILFSIMLFIFSSDLIAFFKLTDPEVNRMAIAYLRIGAAGYLLTFFNLLFMSIFNAHGLTKSSFKSSLVGTIVNIVLDPLFIFVFDWGVEGAAFATIAGRLASMGLFIYMYYKSKDVCICRCIPKREKFIDVLKIGSPAAMQRISFNVIYIFLARIIAEWGATAIAVQKIGVMIESINFMVVGGLTQAVSIYTGQTFGAKEFEKIKTIFKAGVKMAMGMAVAATIVLLVFPEFLFSIFVNEPESISMGRSYLMILAASQIFMCLEMIAAGVFNGLGKTHITATVSIVFTSMRLPLAYFLGFSTALALDGVWWSISISSILKGIFLTLWLIKILPKFTKQT